MPHLETVIVRPRLSRSAGLRLLFLNLCTILLGLFLAAASADAASIWRRTTDGLWREGTNWTSMQPPNLNLGTTYITNGGSKVVLIDALTPSTNLIINGLTMRGVTNATNTLRLADLGPANPLVLSNNSLTLYKGAAIEITNASLVVTGRFIDFNVWAGSVTLDSGSIVAREAPLTTNVTVVTRIGRTNAASLIINGGTVDLTELLIAESPGLQYPRSQGSVRIGNGLLSVAGELSVGNDAGCIGELILTGGHLAVANNQTNITRVGDFGSGLMIVSNALAELSNTSVARHSNSHGLLILSQGGALQALDDFNIGRFEGATGAVYVAGGQLFMTNHPTWVGREGYGQLIVSNGLLAAESVNVTVVPTNSAHGSVTLGGGVTFIHSNLTVGSLEGSTGQVLVAAGEMHVANEHTNALLEIPGGTVTFSGGTSRVDRIEVTSAAGHLALTGGMLISSATTVSNGLPFTVGDGVHPAALRLDGGTHIFADGLVISSNATVDGCGVIVGSVVNQGTYSVQCGTGGQPPVISSQPVSLTVTQGATATFSVTASGDGTLTYQWRFGVPGLGGGNIPGATQSVLAVPDAQPTNAGNYRVIVSNSNGSITSTVASLRVLVPTTASSPTLSGGVFTLSFPSVTGLRYTLDYKDALDDAVWTQADSITGTGSVLVLHDNAALVSTRFYRIRVE